MYYCLEILAQLDGNSNYVMQNQQVRKDISLKTVNGTTYLTNW